MYDQYTFAKLKRGNSMKKSLPKLSDTVNNEAAILVQQLLKCTLKELIRGIIPHITQQQAQQLECYDLDIYVDKTSIQHLRAILSILKESVVETAVLEKIKAYVDLVNKTQAAGFLNILKINGEKHIILQAHVDEIDQLISQGYNVSISEVIRLLIVLLHDIKSQGIPEKIAENTDTQLYFFLLYQLQVLSEITEEQIEQEYGVKIPDEIGAYLSAFPDNPFDQYIFIGNTNQPDIYVVKQVADRLKQSGEFQDMQHKKIESSLLMPYLNHPHFQEALTFCYEHEVMQGMEDAVGVSETTVLKLKALSDELWNSSTDPEEREQFDELRAHEAITSWSIYATSEDDRVKKDLKVLKSLSFSLPSRGNTRTSFDGVFEKPTHNACSDQLGLAVKQWVSAFLVKVNQQKKSLLSVKGRMHQPCMPSF